MSNKIYVYKQPDGVVWADTRVLPGSELLGKFTINNIKEYRKVVRKPGDYVPERVIALANKLIDELPNANPLGFWGRIKRSLQVLWRGY